MRDLAPDLGQTRSSQATYQGGIDLPVQGDADGLLVHLISGKFRGELFNDGRTHGRDQQVVLEDVNAEDVLAFEPEHRVIPRDNELQPGVLGGDGREDGVNRGARGLVIRRQVMLDGVVAPRALGASDIQHESISVGLTEPVVLAQKGDLLGVLEFFDLGNLIEPVGHRLTMLLLDQGEVRRPVRPVDRHSPSVATADRANLCLIGLCLLRETRSL